MEVDKSGIFEHGFHFYRFIFAEQAVIDEESVDALFAERFFEERKGDAGVDAAGNEQENLFAECLRLNFYHLLCDEIRDLPRVFGTAEAHEICNTSSPFSVCVTSG